MIEQIRIAELEIKLKADKLTIVHFTGASCTTCHALEAVLAELYKSNPTHCEIYKVDMGTDEYMDFAARFMIMSLPTVLFFKKDKMIHQFSGIQDKGKIGALIQKFK